MERALAICEELGTNSDVGVNLYSLGYLAHSRKNYTDAQKYFERALVIFEELGRKYDVAANLQGLGDVAFAVKQFAKAQKLYQRSLSVFEQIDSSRARNLGDDLVKVKRQLAKLQKRRKNGQKTKSKSK